MTATIHDLRPRTPKATRTRKPNRRPGSCPPQPRSLADFAARLWFTQGFTPAEVRSWGHPDVAALMEAPEARPWPA